MNTLFKNINNETLTTNGMVAYKSTLDPLVDLFGMIGTNRDKNMDTEFLAALSADSDKALRILQWVRDIREGAGERKRFRDLLTLVAKSVEKETVVKLINKIPEIGRFDDLHVFIGTDYENIALNVHVKAIQDKNGLACKWAPRKGDIANKLRSLMSLSAKDYRKFVVANTNVVEQLMCANKWNEINFSHTPSQASKIYSKAFGRHDSERYGEYITSVIKGEAKMNAAAIFPHDIFNACTRGQARQADAQWKNLPNYLEGVEERILPLSDVSGSMNGTPMSISVALGLYFSERAKGIFKDCVVTFETNPNFVQLKSNATLSERIQELMAAPWGGSTDFEAVFTKLLAVATRNKISADEMPTKLLVISDMQFNQASNWNDTAIEMIRRKYDANGYKMPALIFWNVNGSNVPVKFDMKDVALVSGCSPSVIKAVLGGDIDPTKAMLNAIMKDRYKL